MLQTRDAGTQQRPGTSSRTTPGLHRRATSPRPAPRSQTGGLGGREPHRDDPVHRRRQRTSSPTSRASSPPTAASGTPCSASRSSSTARSSPTRRSTTSQYPTGIDGGNGAEIDGSFSQGEADTLAKQINSGALPIKLKVISQKQVSATLGKQSLRQGLDRRHRRPRPGDAVPDRATTASSASIAALALIVYAILLCAVSVLVPITLTLPGIAGIILTIGVASDANVVIFERVREEARAGKSPRAAILAGYKKGITAIIDANVVTLATAAHPLPVRDRRASRASPSRSSSASCCRCSRPSSRRARPSTCWPRPASCATTASWASTSARSTGSSTSSASGSCGWRSRSSRWSRAVWIGINGLNLGLDFESGTRIDDQLRARSRARTPCAPCFSDLGLHRRQDPGVHASTIDGKHGARLPDADRDAPAGPGAAQLRSAPSTQKFGINQDTFAAGHGRADLRRARSSATRSTRSCSASP